MVASISWTPRALQGMTALKNGGFSVTELEGVKDYTIDWINRSYTNWTVDDTNRTSDNDNHLRQMVIILAVLESAEDSEVSVTNIEAD